MLAFLPFGFFLLLLLSKTAPLGSDDFLSKFRQNKYKLKDFRAELEYYNKDVYNFFNVITYKYNRTTPATNMTFNFKIDLKDKLQWRIQWYKFASNEYRTFPIRYQVNFAQALEADIGGVHTALKCGNITNNYFVKDITYFLCNAYMDENKMPPLIPVGRFKSTIEILYLDNPIAIGSLYNEIYIPVKIPGKSN